MIIYTGSKIQFTEDVRLNRIEEAISAKMQNKFKLRVSKSEVASWRNSLNFMFNLLIDPQIPSSSRVAIEYNIPLTNRRVDFMLTGKDQNRKGKSLENFHFRLALKIISFER